MTRQQLAEQAKTLLSAFEPEEQKATVRIALDEILQISAADLYTHPEEEVSEAAREDFLDKIRRIAGGEPLAYVLGHTEFMALPFQIRPDVLVPRPDTECLVEWILEDWKGKEPFFLDLCTGSGCIGLSVLHYLCGAKADAVDLSDAAIQCAGSNADALGLSSRIRLLQGDLFDAVPDPVQYDFIVSNPPYIDAAAMEELSGAVRQEPRMALFGGTDGLDFYRRIARQASSRLKPGGRLYLEIGYDQGESVPQILQRCGFTDIQVRKDYAGLDRDVRATKELQNV